MDKEKVIKSIEELRDSYELHQRNWATQCLNVIENYVKNSINKDEIINKIKNLEENKADEPCRNNEKLVYAQRILEKLLQESEEK